MGPAGRLIAALAASAVCSAAAADPAAWRIAGANGGEVALLGSMHVLRASDHPLPASVDALYARADSVVMELDLDDLDAAALQRSLLGAAMLPAGKTLRDVLAPSVYALAERMVRLALYATRPIVQVAQGWVPHPEPDVLTSRARRVTGIALLLGALGGLAYAVLAPWAGGVLSGGELTIGWDLAVPMGVNLAAILASQLTGFACLTALGMSRVLSTSTIAGAVVGTALMIPLLLLLGAPGVAWGLAAAELAVLGVQLWKLAPRLRPALTVGS